ncbi:MAG TPA: hypothetical protein VF538_17070 [Pyrinomonadaceae bacterium]
MSEQNSNVKAEIKKLQESLPKIKDDLYAYEVKIFTRTDIEQIFSENRESWGLNKKTSVKSFIDFMGAEGLEEVRFNFPTRKETRYLWGDVSAFELAQSLKPNAYLTHRGAMCIHGLTAGPPDLIYLNQEQPKPHQRSNTLTQEGIDRAFKNKPRLSNEVAEHGGLTVCVVHGQKTGGLGVTDVEGEKGEVLRVTNVERTLIDITVRPAYAGGAAAVLEAYRRARGKVSVTRLIEILLEMDYVYPYHQAVGFYLDRAGVYEDSELRQLQEIPMEFDFYLENRMDEPDYSERWRLYFPRGL